MTFSKQVIIAPVFHSGFITDAWLRSSLNFAIILNECRRKTLLNKKQKQSDFLDIIWTSSWINDIYSINQTPWKSVGDAQNNWSISADSVDALELRYAWKGVYLHITFPVFPSALCHQSLFVEKEKNSNSIVGVQKKNNFFFLYYSSNIAVNATTQ